MTTQIEVTCDACGIVFNKSISEHRRSIRLNRREYCSRKCQSTKAIDNIPKNKRLHPENLQTKRPGKGGPGWQLDEFSPFRQILSIARRHARDRSREFSLTLEYLKNLWDSQDGICPITGWTLKIRRSTTDLLPTTIDRASLDRIDSNLGYIPGNVRFIALIAQYAKNGWDDQDLYEFCEAVCENRK